MLLSALDQTIISTAMPKIIHEFNGLEQLSWVITAYLLASTVIVPIYGKLSDIYGRKYFIISAVVIFLIGSVLSGLSQNMLQLIVFRAIQGLGAGAIFANAFAIIGDLFAPAERGKWQGLFGAVFGLSSIIGPTLGGWLTDNVSWRAAFFINIPVGILALAVVFFLMPHIPAHDKKDRSIDYVGSLFLTISIISLLLGFVWGGSQYPWTSFQIISLFVTSIISTIIFVMIEKRVKEPVLPLDLFKNKIFTISMLLVFISGIGMFGAILYVPLFAQLVLGISATNSGVVLTPLTLGMVVASIISGQIISRTGKYKWIQIFGLAVFALGLIILSRMTPATTQSELIMRMILTGAGLGLTFPITILAVQNAFDHSKLGVATASIQLFRSVGATVGTAILGGVLNNNLHNKLGDLSSDPFIKSVAQFNPGASLSNIDANKLQGILTGDGRKMIEGKISSLPEPIRSQAAGAFSEFINKVKLAFASSITEVFLISAGIMVVAFVVAFFLDEIPLRKTHNEGVTQIGKELAAEEGDFPSKDEPNVV